MLGFWTGGRAAYRQALCEEYETEKARLQAKLKQCVSALEREAVCEELRSLKRELEARLHAVQQSTF